MLLLCNVWNYLKDDVFHRLKHYCLKGVKTLVKCFGDDKVVEALLFGDFILEGGFDFFFEGVLFLSCILGKSSWEKFGTMVDFSFEMEVVVLVVVE